MSQDAAGKAMKHMWDGVMGMGDWVGYAMATSYYAAQDMGFGDQLCEIYGYGFVVIDGLHYITDFAEKNKGMMSTFTSIAGDMIPGELTNIIN